MDEKTRIWGPVLAVAVLLPLAFIGVRACLPPIGATPPPTELRQGSADCSSCHQEVYDSWRISTHARAERTLDPTVLAPLPDGHLQLETSEGSQTFTATRAIGVDPLWQYLIAMGEGRFQVTQTAWDPAKQEWFDVFADGRGPGEWGHWTGGGMNWNAQCAKCHNTGVTKGLQPDGSYETRIQEFGVGCEACHGDATPHLTGGDPPLVAPDRWFDVCASCHASRAELTGRFQPGDRFLDHFRPALVDLTDAFYPDGQVRDENFEYASFVGSTMHERGVTCMSCHDAHSGRLIRDGDALCLGCHQGFDGWTAHDRHGGEVSCGGCHMPITTYMQRDPRHDHGFVLPDPGIEGVPDVCTRCHTDRGPSWARKVADDWWPDRPTERRARADLLRGARQGNREVIPALLKQLASGSPAWRASSALALGAFLDDPSSREGLIEASTDPEGLVRMAATEALAPAWTIPAVANALEARRDETVRSVRIAAQRPLRVDGKADDYRRYLAHNADQPSALLEDATWSLEKAQTDQAVSKLERALSLDPSSAVLYGQLAVAQSQQARPQDAIRTLETALKRGLEDPDLLYRLGLAYHAAGRTNRAEDALQRAFEQDPAHPRAGYNLGVLLLEQGKIAAAIQTLEQAAEHQPSEALDNALKYARSQR
ncbi:MAG: tetratricopeptide repeat protein [Myxococcota bacterium]